MSQQQLFIRSKDRPLWLGAVISFLSLLPSLALALEFQDSSGKFELRSGYFLTSTDEAPNSMGQAFLRWENSASQGNFNFKLAPVLTVDVQDLANVSHVRNHLKSSEAWADYTADAFTMSAGRQSISWGTADGFNPTNIFQAYDFSDPLFPRELTQNSVSLKLHPPSMEGVVFEVVYVVEGTVDVLPFDQHRQGNLRASRTRWGSVFPAHADLGSNFQVPLTYSMNNPEHTPSWDLGTRLRFLQVKHWDYSVAVGKYRRKRPILTYTVEGDPNNAALPLNVDFTPTYARYSMVGFDAAGSFEEIGVRIEAASYMVDSSDQAIGYDSVAASAGLDYLFSEFMFDASFYLNMNYAYIDINKSNEFNRQSIDLAFTEDYFTLKGEMRWTKWVLGNDFVITQSQNIVTTLYTKNQLTPHLALGLAANFLNGKVKTGVGSLNDNHRIIANLEYFF